MSIQDQLEGLKSMNSQVIEQIYREGFVMCKSYILKNRGTADQARDIFQEAMYVLFKNLKRADFEMKSKPSTYLYSVSRNLWLKKIRDSKPTSEMDQEQIEEHVESNVAHVNEIEQKYEAISQSLTSIGDECRKIIKGYYYEQTDLRDLAKQLGYTYQFIRVKKVRCMKKLKEMANKLQLSSHGRQL